MVFVNCLYKQEQVDQLVNAAGSSVETGKERLYGCKILYQPHNYTRRPSTPTSQLPVRSINRLKVLESTCIFCTVCYRTNSLLNNKSHVGKVLQQQQKGRLKWWNSNRIEMVTHK